jgi:hypothetical protein
MEPDVPMPWTTVVLVLWVVLLAPWLPLTLMSGMAFDAGYTVHAYVFIWSLLTYPITVLIAAAFRKKVQTLVLLPCLNVAAFLIAGIPAYR